MTVEYTEMSLLSGELSISYSAVSVPLVLSGLCLAGEGILDASEPSVRTKLSVPELAPPASSDDDDARS